MNKELEEFINLKDERKNSAYAKLKLLIYGVKDAQEVFGKFQDTFKVYDDKNKLVSIDNLKLSVTEGEELVNVTKSQDGISYNIKQMKENNIIERIGATKNGKWIIKK